MTTRLRQGYGGVSPKLKERRRKRKADEYLAALRPKPIFDSKNAFSATAGADWR